MEAMNKLFGLVIVALYARLLGSELFATFSAMLVLFGYCLELSLFSFNQKNLIDYTKLERDKFFNTLWVDRASLMFCTSSLGAIILICSSYVIIEIKVWPLIPVLFLSIVNFDYVLFAEDKGKYVVISRFISQISLLGVLSYFQLAQISVQNIFLAQLLNSVLLTILIIYFCFSKSSISLALIVEALKTRVLSIKGTLIVFRNQLPIFGLKQVVAFLVTIEIPLLMFLQSEAFKEMAVGHRITVILLPFIIFYLNTSVRKLAENSIVKVVFVSCILSCLLIFSGSLLIGILFGTEFLGLLHLYLPFLYLIVLQSFLNTRYYITLKYNQHKSYLARYLVVLILFILCIIILKNQLDAVTLLALGLFKVLLIVLVDFNVKLVGKLLILALMLFPVGFSFALSGLGFFEFTNQFILVYIEIFKGILNEG